MGKYFKYAIGEILLVMVGILLALQINNWNQNKNDEQKVIKILEQIQKDLLNDIQEAQFFSDRYEVKDKILTHYFNGTMPEDFFKDNLSDFISVSLSTHTFVQNKQGYQRLNDQIDIVSSKYDEVLSKLSRLYNERSTFLLKNQTKYNELVQDYRIYLYDNFDWMDNSRISLQNSEEAFNYFYSSDKHRKNLVKHRAFYNRYRGQLTVIKNQSLLCYLVIRDVLKDTNEFPDAIKNFGLEYSYNNINDFVGNYGLKNDSTPQNIIEKKYGVLFMSYPNQIELFSEGDILREHAKDSIGFVSSNLYIMKFERDSDDNVIGFKGYDINKSSDDVELIKLD